MSELDHLTRLFRAGTLSRRDFIGRAASLGIATPTLSQLLASKKASAEESPKPGGILRLGLGGGNTTDSLNPLATLDSVMIDVLFGIYNTLVENGADNRPIPELAERYEARKGATEWLFTLRKGVQFHNGKEFDADDAIYSLNLHRGDTRSGAAGLMKPVAAITKIDTYRFQVTLASADADFPIVLSDYHILMVPKGFTDWSNPIGTGAFTIEIFEPGKRIALKKARPYWKEGRGHLDAVVVTVINDTSARMNALILGQVDAINRADPRTVSRVARSPTLEIVRSAGGWFPTMAMMVDKEPYRSPDVRQALKCAVDRDLMIKALFSGYGSIGNDNPIPPSDPYFNTELPQTSYDPDKAKSLLKKAGSEGARMVLQSSEAAFNGALDMALLLQASASRAGMMIDIKKEPADGYFTNVWLKGPFVSSYWAGRPAATQMLSVAYQSGAPWNETHWRSESFDRMLADAKAETDEDRRKALIWDMQAMLTQSGGSIIPCFRDWLDAHHKRVGGHTPHSGFDMDNGRIAEQAFLIA